MAAVSGTVAGEHRLEFDPVKGLWRLLTSVRFALALIAFLAIASLVGIVIPQLPAPMRGNPAAEAAWLAFERGRFGFLTTSMWRLGLFDVFRSLWFAAGLAALVVSVCVCTANRIGPVMRNVTRPQTRVPDDFFDKEQPVMALAAIGADDLQRELSGRRYKVTVENTAGATYLFADRYPWAQLATFVSHLALILFIAGGLVTVLGAKQEQLLAGEGTSAAVFSTDDADHMQVYIQDAVGKFDATGFPLDYRTSIVVYKGGEKIAEGWTTVNKPLKAGGFKFHQSAYFADGAALRVRDVASGRVVYDDVLALESSASTPRILVYDAQGTVLVDDAVVPTDFLPTAAGTVVAVPGSGRSFWVGAKTDPGTDGWQLIVFETGRNAGLGRQVAEGQSLDLGGGLSLSFAGMTPVPSTVVQNLPGADSDKGAVVELSDGPSGKILTIGPVGGQAVLLTPGAPVVAGAFEYDFVGTREFAGLTVRRDHGASFIWLATGLLLLGLILTFYTPRRRLWGRISDGGAVFRGLGGRMAAIERELSQVGAAVNRRNQLPNGNS